MPALHAALVALVALALAACGSAPTKAPRQTGGYYADDGPPERTPADIAAIPDAVPRSEPFNGGTSRPYAFNGRTYTPLPGNAPLRERGQASWYGRMYHGRQTAIGETYDMFAMTAAHRTLPLPSYVRVTHLESGRSVVVRVNDRGPFLDERVIDLSYAAAMKLGIASRGTAWVEIERVFPSEAPRPAAAVAAPEPPPPAPGHYLQLAAFSRPEGADELRARLAREAPWLGESVQVAPSGNLHRVRAGPFATREEALATAERLRAATGLSPILVPANR